MGDQIGKAVGGELFYIPKDEFTRLLAAKIDPLIKVKLFAGLARINTLYMISRAGSGHIGSSFSSMEIMALLALRRESKEFGTSNLCETFFSSKGHDAPALYSIWMGLGRLDFELLHELRQLDGLPGHPDVSLEPVVTNTGSLGMGVSKAKGMAFAARLAGSEEQFFVLTGDGELQEGQIWESLISAANHNLANLTVFVDHNKLQSDTLVSKVSDLGDIAGKFSSFGWYVIQCDGNNVSELKRAVAEAEAIEDRPQVIIAHTVKGKGVSFMEHTSLDSDIELYKFHSGAPSDDAYLAALDELVEGVESSFSAEGLERPKLEVVKNQRVTPSIDNSRLIDAYSDALIAQADKNKDIVALDADLVLDTGLIPFKEKYPDRFLECGIAEQDMVSQAGGIALKGMLPVVHSFACFLSSRPNEQIYNNATEGTKIIYVGSLAGVIPSGPGHSHQATRDIASLGAIPGLTIIEPSCPSEVYSLLDWAVNENERSTYIRLVSVPCEIKYTLPNNHVARKGYGTCIRQGSDAVIIAYGPVLLGQAFAAAGILFEDHDIDVTIINLPWLNYCDRRWLKDAVEDFSLLITLDNHQLQGGLGAMISCILAEENFSNNLDIVRLGLCELPVCGSSDDVLQHHKLDVSSIVNIIQKKLETRAE